MQRTRVARISNVGEPPCQIEVIHAWADDGIAAQARVAPPWDDCVDECLLEIGVLIRCVGHVLHLLALLRCPQASHIVAPSGQDSHFNILRFRQWNGMLQGQALEKRTETCPLSTGSTIPHSPRVMSIKNGIFEENYVPEPLYDCADCLLVRRKRPDLIASLNHSVCSPKYTHKNANSTTSVSWKLGYAATAALTDKIRSYGVTLALLSALSFNSSKDTESRVLLCGLRSLY